MRNAIHVITLDEAGAIVDAVAFLFSFPLPLPSSSSPPPPPSTRSLFPHFGLDEDAWKSD